MQLRLCFDLCDGCVNIIVNVELNCLVVRRVDDFVNFYLLQSAVAYLPILYVTNQRNERRCTEKERNFGRTEEMRDQIKADVKNKLTGSRGDKVIVAFNANAESKTTVDDIPLTDAPAHYEYLSNECFNKLIVGHRVTSPMLLGIRNGDGGLGRYLATK